MIAAMAAERFLVTGALGCIGAWTCRVLLERGAEVVAFDLEGGSDHRLRLVLDDAQLGRVVRAAGDVTSLDSVERALDAHEITRVIHLAGLQVPACRANPPLGAAVNVGGTVNVFEAVKRRLDRIPRLSYASSAAVYGPGRRDGVAPEAPREEPATIYGVFKIANEGTARVYWQDERVPSLGLRPYVVYGPGRDFGVTSAPTQAMAAAARGESFRIPFGGRMQFQHAEDAARAFVAAAEADIAGAVVANLPAPPAHVAEVVEAIDAATGAAGLVTFDDVDLPFPEELEARALEAAVGALPQKELAAGVRETIEHFRAAAERS
jgi:nucleoside-diphosphate-sugar epimerase